MTFQNKIDPELITLLARGVVDIGMADGTSVIPAVSQGIPVRYGATIYGRDPNVVFSLGETGIETAADLAGTTIGIPGRFGSSWVALQALLASAGLTPDDADITTYPDFGQAVAVAAGQVDAATGFVTNEPVQLGLQGMDVNVLRRSRCRTSAGPGPGQLAWTPSRRRARPCARSRRPRSAPWRRSRPTRSVGLEATFAARARAGRGPRDAAGHPRGHHRFVAGRLRHRERARGGRSVEPGSRGLRSCAHCPTRSSATTSRSMIS